jgi:hypothetical protein
VCCTASPTWYAVLPTTQHERPTTSTKSTIPYSVWVGSRLFGCVWVRLLGRVDARGHTQHTILAMQNQKHRRPAGSPGNQCTRSFWRWRSSADECTESSSPSTTERLEVQVKLVPASSPPAAPGVACAASATPLWERRKRSVRKVARSTQRSPVKWRGSSVLPLLGDADGAAEGAADGFVLGKADGAPEGAADGAPDGAVDGTDDGTPDGAADGPADGTLLGDADGAPDGAVDGAADGSPLGASDGNVDGIDDGKPDGAANGPADGKMIRDADGTADGAVDGAADGSALGAPDGKVEGIDDGIPDGAADGPDDGALLPVKRRRDGGPAGAAQQAVSRGVRKGQR